MIRCTQSLVLFIMLLAPFALTVLITSVQVSNSFTSGHNSTAHDLQKQYIHTCKLNHIQEDRSLIKSLHIAEHGKTFSSLKLYTSRKSNQHSTDDMKRWRDAINWVTCLFAWTDLFIYCMGRFISTLSCMYLILFIYFAWINLFFFLLISL